MTLGVVPNQAGTVAMAVHAAAMLDATSVKVGFCEADYESAVTILRGAREALEGWVAQALSEAEASGVVGKALTPYLLDRIGELSNGRTLAANKALLQNNARVAARIAVALARE